MSKETRLRLIYSLMFAAIIIFTISLVFALGHYGIITDIAGEAYLIYILTFAGILGAVILSLIVVIFYPEKTASKTKPATTPLPVRKIKLRCPACNRIFEIEDTGKKHLEIACPFCGRGGIFRWK